MRNMEETADKIAWKMDGRLSHYDMTGDEMAKLYAMTKQGKPVEALSMAFYYGFVMGHRATLSGTIKNKL